MMNQELESGIDLEFDIKLDIEAKRQELESAYSATLFIENSEIKCRQKGGECCVGELNSDCTQAFENYIKELELKYSVSIAMSGNRLIVTKSNTFLFYL